MIIGYKHFNLDFKKIDPYILLILRIGVWQLKFGDKIPAFAAIDESVKLAKFFQKKHFSGFVNGVLRKINSESLDLPKKRKHLEFGFSAEIFGLYKKWFGGEKTIKILKNSMSSPRDLTILFIGNVAEKEKWLSQWENIDLFMMFVISETTLDLKYTGEDERLKLFKLLCDKNPMFKSLENKKILCKIEDTEEKFSWRELFISPYTIYIEE